MDRGERPIKLGDSSYSPKCLEGQPRNESAGGRATNWARAVTTVPNPDELRMPV